MIDDESIDGTAADQIIDHFAKISTDEGIDLLFRVLTEGVNIDQLTDALAKVHEKEKDHFVGFAEDLSNTKMLETMCRSDKFCHTALGKASRDVYDSWVREALSNLDDSDIEEEFERRGLAPAEDPEEDVLRHMEHLKKYWPKERYKDFLFQLWKDA